MVEVITVCTVTQIAKPLKASLLIIMANLLSFLLPYIIMGLVPVIYMEDLNFFEMINFYANRHPTYIVGIAFLLFTLLIEIPIIYNLLKKDVANKKCLFFSTVAVNCATTFVLAVIERIVFRGSW